jgi:hypothetical protein
MVVINDSNWYIKRLNNIEIDIKMRYSGPLSHHFRMGGFAPKSLDTGASIDGPHTLSPLF